MVVAALDSNYEAFVIYIAIFNISFDSNTQLYYLKNIEIAYLKIDKISIKVSCKYTNFLVIFLLKLVIKSFKYMSINNHIIKLVND